MLERYDNTGEKGMEYVLLLSAPDKWLHAMAGQHGKQCVIEENGEPQETAPAVLLPEIKGDETLVASEVGHIQGLPIPRHPADGVLVKAQRQRQRRAIACRTPEGAGVQHASRRIDAPEGGCGGVQEQRSTTGYLKHNRVKIE